MQLVLHRAYLCERTGEADVWPQARDHLALVKVVAFQKSGGSIGLVGNPERDARVGPGKPRRQHAHHDPGAASHMDRVAEDGGIAMKPTLEEAPVDNHDGAAATVFRLTESMT